MGRPSRVRVTGPLTLYAAGFRKELAGQGYTANASSNQLQLMAHASRWLTTQGLGVAGLDRARVEEFLAQRRAEGYTLWLSTRAMEPVLSYLRELGAIPVWVPPAPGTEAERLEEHYRAYLVQERGLAPATVTGYLHVARLFVAARCYEDQLRLEELTATEVTEFVLAECATRSVGSAKYVVCGLRSLLRYLYAAGHTDAQLTSRCPRWRAGASLVCRSRSDGPRCHACLPAATGGPPSAGATTRY